MKEHKKKLLRKNILGNQINKILVFSISAIFLVLIDQILKKYFITRSYYFNLFSLHLVKNTGISFGMLQGTTVLMIIISLVFLCLLWFFRREFEDCYFCLMLLVAGTLGNLIDRIFRGYVIDFFDLGWFPVFNLSDALITLAAIGIIIKFISDIKKEKQRTTKIKN